MYFNNFSRNGEAGFDFGLHEAALDRLNAHGALEGKDPFDGSPCRFLNNGGSLREGFHSTVSRSVERQRSIVKGLSQYLFGSPDKTLLQCCDLINQTGKKLYTAEANSAIFDFLKKNIRPSQFFFSEYFGPAYRSGDLVDGVAHQDLQQLSFPDAFFDVVMTAEVMEHVPDALAAEREIIRVLKPGGGYIFTVPYMANTKHDNVRAVMENGQVKHLEEPQYHGDPVRPKEGILVFRIFSEGGLMARFAELGAEFTTYHIFDEASGIISVDSFVHVVVKNSQANAGNGAMHLPEKAPAFIPKINTGKEYGSFIFTHIPKCGGTSFREYIYHTALDNGIEKSKIHVPGYGGLSNQKNISQLDKEELNHFRRSQKMVLAAHCKFGVHEEFKLNMADPFYYILLREPVGRFISHYNFFHRRLGYRNMKGIHLNDLDKDALQEMLERMANIQLTHLINGVNFVKSRQPFLIKLAGYGKRCARAVSFGKLFVPKPVGIKADPAWLDEAERLLGEVYGAFGVLEKMEASLQLLRASAPSWLQFTDMPFPEKNEGTKIGGDNPIREDIIEAIKHYNRFDIMLHEMASRMLDEKMQNHQST